MSIENSNFYTFLVTSHINTAHSAINNDVRFNQTIDTISSIRNRVPNAKILFCDNSIVPLDQNQSNILRGMVDRFVNFENNLFTKYVSKIGHNKGLNEMLVIAHMLQVAKKENLIGKRLFKLSGRYLLKDTFDITEYEKEELINKYVFRITTWVFNAETNPTYKDYFNTVLYSMPNSLVDEYEGLLQEIFDYMLYTGESMEYAHHMRIPKENLKIVKYVQGCGYMANNQYIDF